MERRVTRGFNAMNACLLLISYFLILHAILLIWDFNHPDVFMNADRASTRFSAMENLLSKIGTPEQDISQTISSCGIIGDYFFHAMLYGVGGRVAILSVQILLAGVSLLAVFWLALILTDQLSASIAAALIYMHLPYSLIYPHMLASEALFSPLVLFSFAALAAYLMLEKRDSLLIASALLIGLAALIRPIAVLWPVVVVVIGYMIARMPIKSLLSYLLIALTPMLVWMFIMQFCSGQFSMGRSGHDLNHNLYGRVELISRTLPPKIAEDVRVNILQNSPMPRELPLTSYIAFVTRHPLAAANHYKNDLVAYTAKSGIEAVLLDYLNYYTAFRSNLRNPGSNWRRSMDRHGIFHVIRDIFKRQPLLMSTTIFGSLVMLTLWIGYMTGFWRSLRERRSLGPRLTTFVLLLALLPPYVFASSTLAWNVHSRHRAPAEFSIVILTIAGACGFTRKLD